MEKLEDFLIEDYINLQFFQSKTAEEVLGIENCLKHIGDDDYFVKKRISINHGIPFNKIQIIRYEYIPNDVQINELAIRLPATGFDEGKDGVWCVFKII